MSKAAGVTIAEVDEILEEGQLDPDLVQVPGIHVDRLYKAPHYESRIAVLSLILFLFL